MRRPASMAHGNLIDECLGQICGRFRDHLAETGDFSDCFEEDTFVFGVAVDTYSGGVVTAVFETGESVAKDVADGFAILLFVVEISVPCSLSLEMKDKTNLFGEIRAISEDSTHSD
jgi:hypothetical protein